MAKEEAKFARLAVVVASDAKAKVEGDMARFQDALAAVQEARAAAEEARRKVEVEA